MGSLLLSGLGCRSALQLITPVGPVETSVTPAEILAVCSPQLGPTLAAVYKLIVVEGWLHLTAGEGNNVKDSGDLSLSPVQYRYHSCTRLQINSCPIYSH